MGPQYCLLLLVQHGERYLKVAAAKINWDEFVGNVKDLYSYSRKKGDLNIYVNFIFYDLKIKSIKKIRYKDIEIFINKINYISIPNKRKKKRKASTIHRIFSTIRGFHQYLYQNKLALKDILSVNPLGVVSTGMFTLLVLVVAYPITTSGPELPFTIVNVSASDKADLPLIKVSIKLESTFI